jgi:signal transduction histidine kinase
LISGGNVIGVLFLGYIDETPRALDQLDLIASFARQATASVENARLRQQQVFAAATRERAKLSRNLHDSVLQSLYSLALGLRTAQHYLAGTDSPAREPLEYSLQLADSAQAEMRALVLELRPETLENEGLVVALNRQAQVLCERKGIALHVITTPEPAIPFEHKEMLYRIAIEGIQNAVKHACATCVDLALQDTSGGIRMSIVDNGVGFDPGQNYAGHVGLISMRERAAESGALLQIDSKPGHGTRVIIDMPLIATEGARAVQRPA